MKPDSLRATGTTYTRGSRMTPRDRVDSSIKRSRDLRRRCYAIHDESGHYPSFCNFHQFALNIVLARINIKLGTV